MIHDVLMRSVSKAIM